MPFRRQAHPSLRNASNHHHPETCRRSSPQPQPQVLEMGADIGVSPGVTAVGGLEDVVSVVVREASASFIHAGDVHVACREVAGNLDVADKGSLCCSRVPGCATWRRYQWRR